MYTLQNTETNIKKPKGIAIDDNGNLYVIDGVTHSIYKIKHNGGVKLFAGSGRAGFQDGSRMVASFNTPSGIAIDEDENIYVTDENNHSIRKIDTRGQVSTLAGNGIKGFSDGIGAEAQFFNPIGIVYKDGFLYVADSKNNRIRKISRKGIVSTIAGDGIPGYKNGQGIMAQFDNPTGVALDDHGQIFISDCNNNVIRKIDSLYIVSTYMGNGKKGYLDDNGSKAAFNLPYTLITDYSTNSDTPSFYVLDAGNHAIRYIDTNRTITTICGVGTPGFKDGDLKSVALNFPKGFAVAKNQEIFIADNKNNKIRKIGHYYK